MVFTKIQIVNFHKKQLNQSNWLTNYLGNQRSNISSVNLSKKTLKKSSSLHPSTWSTALISLPLAELWKLNTTRSKLLKLQELSSQRTHGIVWEKVLVSMLCKSSMRYLQTNLPLLSTLELVVLLLLWLLDYVSLLEREIKRQRSWERKKKRIKKLSCPFLNKP